MPQEMVINDRDSELASAPSVIRTSSDSIRLNLEDCGFIRPDRLVRWRCIIDLALECGRSIQITPPKSVDAKNYAGRMELFKGTDYVYPFQQNNPDTFFPLIKITNDRNESIYEECLRVFGYSKATSNYVNRVSDAFVELADNIYFHSGEKVNSGWGYIHAQAHPQSGIIRLGICDVGVGIYGSYERTGQLKGRTEENLVRDVFEEMESSLNVGPGKGHRGLGLHEVREFINTNTGLLTMRTGNMLVYVNQTGVYPQRTTYKTEGTWIELRIPIR